ncbi:MAG: SOS response-associated peptidase [Planctomycetia bacterium]|nr:SOS response-associated peptidase [Planctomycetia bacterium]
MCGRFTLRTSPQKVAEHFALAAVPELPPRYNIAPSQAVAVVRAKADGQRPVRELALMEWGLIPSWAHDPKETGQMINARCETAANWPTFRSAFCKRRCLIPADGFYEWQKTGGKKQPFFIGRKDGEPFGFAGLWEIWGEGENSRRMCAILTTDANDVLRPIHDRMPVIVAPADYALWLDPAVDSPEPLAHILAPYPAEEMTAWPVSTLVNKPANDTPQCVERFAPPRDLFGE